ncbi:hypothetical protein AVEN_57316-1, partial [Araneus ventricosus]
FVDIRKLSSSNLEVFGVSSVPISAINNEASRIGWRYGRAVPDMAFFREQLLSSMKSEG